MLEYLQEFLEAVFLGVALKLQLDTPSVLSSHTKDQTRVQPQEARNSWSDRWIMLKFLQEFQEACFIGIAVKSPWDAAGVWLCQTTNQTIVPARA
jgi:hypothetical protein